MCLHNMSNKIIITYFAWLLNCISVSITFNIAVLQISAADPVRSDICEVNNYALGTTVPTCLVLQNSQSVSQHVIDT